MIKFKKFYFDGNLRWGWFHSPTDVIDLLKYYDYKMLRQALSLNKSSESFGFYSEYDGDETFGEWIDKNNQNKFFNIKYERKLKLDKIMKK